MRQLTDDSANPLLTQTYDPYGTVYASVGAETSSYGYTGEQVDANGLVYLRARYYQPGMGRFLNIDPSRMEMNPYQYGLGNPILYTDPSGLIEEDIREAGMAHMLINKLDRDYGIKIEIDFGWWKVTSDSSTYYEAYFVKYDPRLEFPYPCGSWVKGVWTIVELQTIDEAVRDLAAMMSSDRFRELVGYVKMSKEASTCGRGCTSPNGRTVEFRDEGNPALTVDISNSYNFDKWTVVHELGHVMDQKSRHSLSLGLVEYTNGILYAPPLVCDSMQKRPGCNNAGYYYGGSPPKGSDANFDEREDFAESVAASVYPTYAQSKVAEYKSGPYARYLYYSDYTATKRWDYIQEVFSGTISP